MRCSRYYIVGTLLLAICGSPICYAEESQPGDAQPAVFQEHEFKQFSPETGEFRVLMPEPVTVKEVNRSGIKFKSYSTKNAGHDYSVNGGICLSGSFSYQAFLFGYEASIKRSIPNISIEESEASGAGWNGKRLSLSLNGKRISSALVCSATKFPVVYELRCSAPIDSKESKTFLNSFEIDNAKLPAYYQQNRSERVGAVLTQIGPYLLIGFGIFFTIVSVVVAVFVIGYLRKQKKERDGEVRE